MFACRRFFSAPFGMALVTGLILLAGPWALGQTPATPPIPPVPAIPPAGTEVIEIESPSRALAEDYIDILEQLLTITHDYRDYFTQEDYPLLESYLAKMNVLVEEVDHGDYAGDPAGLASALKVMPSEMHRLAHYIKTSKEIYPMKLYQLAQSYEREMESITALLEVHLTARKSTPSVQSAKIAEYVRARLAGADIRSERMADGKVRIYVVDMERNQREEQRKVEKAMRLVEKATEAQLKALEKLDQRMSGKGAPPVNPVMPLPGPTGTGEPYNKYVTLEPVSSRMPIRVINQLGGITITGTDEDEISANLLVEIDADTRQEEKVFVNSVRLHGEVTGVEHRIDAEIPSQKNNGARVVSSMLTVSVPTGNPLIVDGMYGPITIQDIEASVTVTGAYSTITVASVEGPVTINNTMGPIQASDISGSLEVTTSYAAIQIADCKGQTIEVNNSYSPINMSSTSGNVTINNTGSVEIITHDGNIAIQNSFGPINISDVHGAVSAVNAYNPIEVADVDGSLELSNSYSSIRVSEVSGAVTLSNKYGSIELSSIEGPLTIDSDGGPINLEADEQLKGNSAITANNGRIEINLSSALDLVIEARTNSGGAIHAEDVPMRIQTRGELQTALYTLGRGTGKLSLVGNNSVIYISEQ